MTMTLKEKLQAEAERYLRCLEIENKGLKDILDSTNRLAAERFDEIKRLRVIIEKERDDGTT